MKKPVTPKARRYIEDRARVREIRLTDECVADIDAWARRQGDRPGRSEAIRRLVEIGLSQSSERSQQVREASAVRAAELAETVVDQHIAPDTPLEERAVRKRKLIQGPSMVRQVRKDRAT